MLDITTLEEIVINSELKASSKTIQKYKEFAQNGVFIMVHPVWCAFNNPEEPRNPIPDTIANLNGSEKFQNSQNMLEEYIKQSLIKALYSRLPKDMLPEYSRALSYLNNATFFSVSKETQPLVILVQPGKYYEVQEGIDKKTSKPKYWNHSEGYMEYIGQSTNNLDNFISLETEHFDSGSINESLALNLSSFLNLLNIDDLYIIGGNINQCLKVFINQFKELHKENSGKESTGIQFNVISDLCHVTAEYCFDEGILPDGEPLKTAYQLTIPPRQEWMKNPELIGKLIRYTFEELQDYVYSFKDLNDKLYPEKESYWKNNELPFFLRSIEKKLIKRFTEPDQVLRSSEVQTNPTLKRFSEIVYSK